MNVVEQYKNKDIIFSKIDLERMHRNITCKKNNCYINGGECASTTDIKYAKRFNNERNNCNKQNK